LDEQKYGVYSKVGVEIRVILFGQYLGYHLCRLFSFVKVNNSNLTTMWFATRLTMNNTIEMEIITKRNGQEGGVKWDFLEEPVKIKKHEGTRLSF
jgi:hypothetical protein